MSTPFSFFTLFKNRSYLVALAISAGLIVVFYVVLFVRPSYLSPFNEFPLYYHPFGIIATVGAGIGLARLASFLKTRLNFRSSISGRGSAEFNIGSSNQVFNTIDSASNTAASVISNADAKMAGNHSINSVHSPGKSKDAGKMELVSNQITSPDLADSKSAAEAVVGASSSAAAANAATHLQLDNALKEIADQKNRVEEEFVTIKNDSQTLKKEISDIQNNIKDLKSVFETTLVDIKAFQAEMVNPINYMRSYFDTLDIKNLSDPTIGFQKMGKLPSSIGLQDTGKLTTTTTNANDSADINPFKNKSRGPPLNLGCLTLTMTAIMVPATIPSTEIRLHFHLQIMNLMTRINLY